MNQQKYKRSRGIVFTVEGWQKLQAKRKVWESENKSGTRCTLEELSELTGLAYNTVLKIVERQKGVDKRSLVKFSMAFDLELSSSDYVSSNSLKKSDTKHTVGKVSWDKTIELPFFFGRATELTLLEKWLVSDHCRLVTVQGIGGIGKTALCVKLVELVEPKFNRVVWRSLENKPSLKELLADLLEVLLGQSQLKNASELNTNYLLRQFINYLRSHRCLIVLDSLDTIMLGNTECGSYVREYDDYHGFIKCFGEALHKSCLLLTTREKPKEVVFMEGESLPVRSLNLDALPKQIAKKILLSSGLLGTEIEQNILVEKYFGHPLALKIVAQKIHSTFDGEIALFLQQNHVNIFDLKQLFYQHIERLSGLEREILCKLAFCSEPVSFPMLRQNISLSVLSHQIIDSLESLLRRSLIFKKSAFFTMHPQLLIYVNLWVTNDIKTI